MSRLRTALFAALFVSLAVSAGARKHDVPLDALAGEYTSAANPDEPLSFYAQDGKLVVESERHMPSALDAADKTEDKSGFTDAESRASFRFRLSWRGNTLAVSLPDSPVSEYKRTGPPVHHCFYRYQRSEVMIPMRDGVRLHTVILTPTDIAAPLPFLIVRTPYGADKVDGKSFFATRPNLAREGYLYVAQDIRGRYASEGEFVMSRPLADHSDPKRTDESADAWDTVAWLLKNISNNNGRAGFIGTSYPGFLAMAAGVDPHPAVRAISPQAPMIDVWLGDDFFHNGAFRLSYGYDYVYGMESKDGQTEVSYGQEKDGRPRDGYDFFLDHGSFAEAVRRAGRDLPTWRLFLDHPAYDPVWRERGVEYWLGRVAVPTLTVGGYYDQEDMYGPQEEYARLEPHDSAHQNFLVLGPWRHGSWSLPARRTGELNWGRPVGDEYRAQIEAKFFAFYLKDAPGFDLADTASFQTGSNQWKRYSHFPPSESKPTRLYLAAQGRLSWSAPTEAASTSYVSDPANPVPYRHRPILPTYAKNSGWADWLTEDQRFVAGRKDVTIWKLPALAKPLTITGNVEADLFVSTTGTDGDLVVKLIDQYPDDDPDPRMRGYQRMIAAEIFRGRYLDSFEQPKAIEPGAVREFHFSLRAADHVFEPGHTVLVEVQSSWFPLYDRNPQSFVPNIMTARPEDYRPARITIYSGPGRDSNLVLPVVSR